MRNIIYNDDKVALDSGIFFGKGIFETILIKDKAILLKEHIKRANDAIKFLKLGEPISADEVSDFINKNNIVNKALKIVVTENNLIYTLRDIKYSEKDYKFGFRVRFSSINRNPTSPITYIKSLNYLDNILEYELAKSEGFNEAIFLNSDGYIAEGCTTNIFMIKGNEIITPAIECGILPGIIRDWVINNYKIVEKKITKEELLSAEEIFLTNSLVGIIKVKELCGIEFNSKLIEKVQHKYFKCIDKGAIDYE